MSRMNNDLPRWLEKKGRHDLVESIDDDFPSPGFELWQAIADQYHHDEYFHESLLDTPVSM